MKQSLKIKPIRFVVGALLVILGSLFGQKVYAQPAGFDFYKTITLTSGQISGTHTNFPVLISTTDTDLRTVANGGKVTNANGYDIRFTLADKTTVLTHEIESYNPTTGKVVAWVRFPTLSATVNTTIYMYYGNSAISTNPSSNSTWNSNYLGVYHFNSSVNDATANARNLTNNSTANLSTGKIGAARELDNSSNVGSNGSGEFLQLPNSVFSGVGNFTFSGWVYQNRKNTNWERVFDFGQSTNVNFYFTTSTGTNSPGDLQARIKNGGGEQGPIVTNTAADTGVWIHWAVVLNDAANTMVVYRNGVQYGTANNVTLTPSNLENSTSNYFGRSHYTADHLIDADFDEFKLANTNFSANWILTEYRNQNSPATFLTFSARGYTETTPPTAPQNVSATAITGSGINITFGDVNETGSGVTSYSVKRSTTQGSGYTQIGTVTDNNSATYTFTDNTAANNTTYYYVVTAIDAAGNASVVSNEVNAKIDATAPVLETATVNGTSLVLDYNENLKLSSIPAVSAFAVLVNGSGVNITNVVVSGDDVILTLAQGVEQGNVVSISYTVGANPIKDTAGNNAANLSARAVTNTTISSLPTPPIELQATALAGGSIEITFDDVNASVPITSYTIKRAIISGGAYTNLGTVADNESVNYTFTDNTAVNGTTYYYVVTSTDQNAIESSESDELSATADATAPVLQLTTVAGEYLVLDYNETMDVSPIASISDFTVRVNGGTRTITYVSIVGSRVILGLDPEVTAGDNVEVDYSPATNPVQDAAGNDAPSISAQNATNNTWSNATFGPDPCPISNNQDAAWACFSGIYGGTSLTANVGGLNVATVTAVGANTTFAPNALQQWASGAFSGDQFNGPQANPTGASGDATSFDVNIPANIPSDALILSLNRLRPNGGATSYTLEAYDGANNKITIDDWITGQGTDGGVCTNSVVLNYTNGNTTIEFQPVVSGNSSCASSSKPIWFRITDNNVRRIELRKTATNADNIHLGLAVVADFGDAPNTFGTLYSGLGTPPAFHLLNNSTPNTVYFGAGVDGDGNGYPNATADGDDTEASGLGSGDDEDGRSSLTEINSAQTSYQTTLVCTNGGYVGGWIDFDLSGTFDVDEYTAGQCATGSVVLTWTGLTSLVEGESTARFRISSIQSEVASPVGAALDGEVEDYPISIIEPPMPDLELTKTVNNSSPVEGDNISFSLTVVNPGEFEATGIRVTDQLPSGLTFASATASQGSYNSGTGIWNVGTIAEGDSLSATLTISATVNTGTLGNTIVNQASITKLNETDPELNNNSASAGITVVPEQADIQIAKIVSNNNPIEGEFIDYTVSVTNNGPKAATNLKILDQIPTGIEYMDSTASQGSYNPTSGIWNIGTLGVGASASLVINTRIEDNTEGTTINNTSTLQSMDQVDPVDQNNTSTAPITVVVASANLSCGLPYLKFRNPTLISGSPLQVGATYRFNNILAGVYAKVEIVTMSNATLSSIDDPATSGLPDDFSPFVENVTGDDGFVDFEISFFDSATNVSRFLSFSATTSDVDGTGNLRDFVGYQNLSSFIVENTTNLIADAEGIYTTFVSSDFNNTTPGANDYTDYKVYASYTNEPRFKLRAGVKSNGTIDDRIISVSFDPCEINTFNNPVTQSVVDVAVTKTVDDNSVNVGQTVTYTIQAKNTKASAVGSVQITDQLPNGLTFVSSNPSQGAYNSGSGVWNVGNLTGLQTANLQIVATVNTGTQGNIITNTASLTSTSGIDGLASNNSASATISVFNPASGLSCNQPPQFSFINHTLENGVQNQVNSVYRYSNVASGIDALVKITNINNATINTLDDNGGTGQSTISNFSPLFTTNNGTSAGYIDWEVKFVQSGTNTLIKRDFAVTALDIDGTSNNGKTVRDYYGFAQNQSNTVQSGNNLSPITVQGDFEIFQSSVTTDATSQFDINHMAYITYKYTSIFALRTGSFPTGGYNTERLVEFNFTPCLNEEFTNPVVSTRDADLAVTKTVDEANPLENTNINFTITVANGGNEKATEVVISEALPTGLTLVEAAPSKGTYNQITKLWNVGTLNNGASATLAIEASVDQGVTADSLINKAYVAGFNQFDPNVSNDTSKVVIKIGVELKGTIFEDITGNGVSEDMTFNDASGDQQALENVEVHLFRDGGDGVADGADDSYVTTKLTGNLGGYTFKIGDDADYWVVVDSKTGELSNGTYWAEQTYAPNGALCADGSGNTQTLTSAGHCFGGRRAGISDNISTTPVVSDLINAEHVAKVAIAGTGVTGINFGFSFNVVTNTNDTDDDGTANRSNQGSLRQFITNANQIAGANTMRFVPSVPTNAAGSGGNWWAVTLNSELPAIIDALTTINGVAYQNNSPKTTRNDNSGSIGTGGSVGIDNLTAAIFERKEFEINLNDVGANALSVNSSGAYTVRNVAVYNNATGIRVVAGSGGLLEKNMIGARADGTDPSGGNRLDTGILFDGGSSVTPLIQQNYVAYLNGSGVKSTNQSSSITVLNNEIYQAALSSTTADGVEGIGTWVIRQNRIHSVGNGSSSAINGGNGIELGSTSGTSTGNTVRNNTIYNNAVTGITTTNGVTSTLIEKNVVYQNGTNYSGTSTKSGAGVKLTTPNGASQSGIKITRNSFYNNYGISIDQVTSGSGTADGVSPNDGVLVSATSTPNRGLDYPQFSLATLEGGVLYVEGFVGTTATKLQQTYTIEVYKAEDDGDSDAVIEVGGSLIRGHGEGRHLIGVITSNSNGTFSASLTVPGGFSLAYNDRITAIAISSANNTSEFSANHRIVPTGVTISGYVYHDVNHNQNKDGTELGLENITVVLYNTAQNNCKSVLTNTDGYYVFNNVLNGNYDLIESYGQSVPTPDICTPAQTDPDDYISTTPNLRTVTVNNLPAMQDFGDFEGSKLTGTVFNDNGIGGGTANDGLQNGGEAGISTQVIKALTSGDALIEQTSSAADGSYSLFIPKSVVPTGNAVKVQEVNGASYLSTGGDAGTTVGTYTIATDITQFSNTVGEIYTSVDFADIPVPSLLTDGTKSIQPGAVARFTHQFLPNTAGDVIFTTTSVNNPDINFPTVLNNDLNCNGEIDSGEPILTETSTVSVTALETICLIVRVTAPNGLNDGATSTTTITATFDLTNSPSNIQNILTRTDIITVSTADGGFVIIKAVDKGQALPGDTLTYSIGYENLGDEAITQVEVVDEIPVYTTYSSSSCGTLPSGVTNCQITAPSIGTRGTIRWTFIGVLQPGESGTVSYKVLIDN